ncbi:hypothetical protein [Shouchella clausii]|uniref:Uncharacterized protein n=1 Tax=Shouchella clausii TaxID=79880 RepID=A0A268S3S7_SHOCL|nr:hypothetical protein [Shouchella clausii]PAD13327.1 hypothetical protein CHH74_12215 [Shouchella clausii]PAF26586.1 hypothetical protein CHH61_08200 [Shouchella clausii]
MSFILVLAILVHVIALFVFLRRKSEKDVWFGILGMSMFIAMVGLSVNVLVSDNPLLFHYPGLLWGLIAFGLVIEVVSLAKKSVSGQLIAASLHLFLVFPTIFSIGIILLVLAIMEIVGAILFFMKYRQKISYEK